MAEGSRQNRVATGCVVSDVVAEVDEILGASRE